MNTQHLTEDRRQKTEDRRQKTDPSVPVRVIRLLAIALLSFSTAVLSQESSPLELNELNRTANDDDGDLVLNGEEYILGLDPLNPATFGVPDSVWVSAFDVFSISPSDGDAWDDDWDSDGHSNLEELALGSDPRNSVTDAVFNSVVNEFIGGQEDTSANGESNGGDSEESSSGDGSEETEEPSASEPTTQQGTDPGSDWWEQIPIIGGIIDFFQHAIDALDSVGETNTVWEEELNKDASEGVDIDKLSDSRSDSVDQVLDATEAGAGVTGTAGQGPTRMPGL